MKTWTGRSLMILTLLIWSVAARAADAPAATGGGATGGGVKDLPGTVEKDVTGAVQHDLGMGGTAKAPDDKAAAKKAPAGDADEDEGDSGDDEDAE